MLRMLGSRSITGMAALVSLLVLGVVAHGQGGFGDFGGGKEGKGGAGGLPGIEIDEALDRPEVIVELVVSQARVAPGSEFVIGVVLDHAES